MPVSPERSPHYHLGYSFQLVTICMSAYMYFGVDSVAFSSVIFGCAQIGVIKDKIMSIKPLGIYRNHKTYTNISRYNRKTLIECVKHHQAVISFTELVEDTYNSYLLFQLVGSVGIICGLAQCPITIPIAILCYLSVMISQLFVCCWCGHELSATSEELHTILYNCAWYDQDVKFKRDLNFMMARARRPILLRAGYYISLSRQSFVSILRMSYSYFAVLNQTNK
uniref:Odorant receptor 16 n=1 Tax=Bombyx mori TaxID=7091 RepID=A7E3G0_BOMMO|nr:TPA_exp: odorant receptor 16 [Bombyx mori]